MLTQIEGFDATATLHPRRKTYGVNVGHVRVGGGAPIVVQSMTNTDTADVDATLQQTPELAEAGSEIVRWTVNVPEAAAAVPEIKKRLLAAGCNVPIIGDFHYNGHVLLTKYPDCAVALDKYRINPGNVGAGQRRDEQFSTICKIAARQRQARAHRRQRRLPQSRAGHAQDAGKHRQESRQGIRRNHQRLHGAVRAAIHRTRAGIRPAPRSNHYFLQDLAPARPDHRLSRPLRENRAAAAPRPDRSRHGHEGPDLVRRRARRPAPTKASATPSAFRSRRNPAAIAAKKSTPPAKSSRRWACARFRPA